MPLVMPREDTIALSDDIRFIFRMIPLMATSANDDRGGRRVTVGTIGGVRRSLAIAAGVILRHAEAAAKSGEAASKVIQFPAARNPEDR